MLTDTRSTADTITRAPEAPAVERSPSFAHQPALDGLRGIAVGTVLLFHAGISWAAGGFAGIDVFFVLSGFLITTLLLAEVNRTGTISLRDFWARRARRLLPALYMVLIVVALGAWLVAAPSELGGIRRDGLATLFYVSNWAQIGENVGYFDRFTTPSPLLHTWSLAVEEQYYLVWPLVALLVIRIGRPVWVDAADRRRQRWERSAHRRLGTVAAIGAGLSVTAMAVLSLRGASIDRIYLGTDTRVYALLIGSWLAVRRWGRWGEPSDGRRRPASRALDLAGFAGLAFVALFTARHWDDDLLNRGGYFLLTMAAAAAVAAATQPGRGLTTAVLDVAPLRWLGRISYGAYLWHWPIFVYLSPRRFDIGFWPLTILRLAVTLLFATLSLRLIERPMRQLPRMPRWVLPVSTVGVAIAILAATAAAVPTDTERFARDAAANAAPPPVEEERPVPPATTKVLIVGDSLAASVARSWPVGGPVTVVDRSFPTCGLATEKAQPPPCGDWRTVWPAAVAEVRPDVTLLVARSWHPLSQNPELDVDYTLDIARPNNLLIDDLQAVASAAAASGGALAIATLPRTAVDPGEDAVSKMFSSVALQMATSQPDRVAVLDLAAGGTELCSTAAAGLGPGAAGVELGAFAGPTVTARLATELRQGHLDRWSVANGEAGAAADVTKVLMVGDSVGWSLGSYWYGQTGRPAPEDPIRLWNRAQFFCELDDGPRVERSGKVDLSEKCRNWRTDWARYVTEFSPDVVVMMVGSWEVFDRRIGGELLKFGQPAYDA
ncbi:MAG TPA: acyltransferase, partial [Microthrixaceae bacterium]|nr:acyltransferase [Microthrixaceae bacterium]